MCESVRENKDLNIDWGKFKSNAKADNLIRAKQGYMEFCKMLNEVDFELVGDYTGIINKVKLTYKLDNDVKLNISPSNFKRQTYKTIINFKNELEKNGDELIKFVRLTGKNSFITNIKTFDEGNANVDMSRYKYFVAARRELYNCLKEVGGKTIDYYKDASSKINISIEGVRLNPISSNTFKYYTYKAIVRFKNKLKENNDKFIKFVDLNDKGSLIAKIKTFDGMIINMGINNYNSFTKGRVLTYDYCKEREYKILSPYIGNQDKILIDFNCGHDPHWIKPDNLKQNKGCPVCNESKGEKAIRAYLENNNISFSQEYRFNDCKYKKELPFDFYIPSEDLCIEFDGAQHFESFEHFGGEEKLKITQTRDEIKNKYCKDNGINLLRIPYYEIDKVENILNKEFKRLIELRRAS